MFIDSVGHPGVLIIARVHPGLGPLWTANSLPKASAPWQPLGLGLVSRDQACEYPEWFWAHSRSLVQLVPFLCKQVTGWLRGQKTNVVTEASTRFPPVSGAAPGMGVPNQVSASFLPYPLSHAFQDTGVGL